MERRADAFCTEIYNEAQVVDPVDSFFCRPRFSFVTVLTSIYEALPLWQVAPFFKPSL